MKKFKILLKIIWEDLINSTFIDFIALILIICGLLGLLMWLCNLSIVFFAIFKFLFNLSMLIFITYLLISSFCNLFRDIKLYVKTLIYKLREEYKENK